MDISETIRKFIRAIIQIFLILVPLAVLIRVLFGPINLFVGSNVVENLIGLFRTLGDNGLLGLIVLAIIVWVFALALDSRRV